MNANLDADELLHLAIEASQNDNNDASLGYLKQAIEKEPDNAKTHYMLGAIHAEIGMYERAIEDMRRATELDDTLYTAHFQLGLLYITSGMVEQAISAWAPLDRLGENDALFLFKRGLTHLVNNEFQECIDDLTAGIDKNEQNKPLNKDMAMIIEQARQALGGGAPHQSPEKPQASANSSHVYLSAYEDDNEK